MTPTMPSDTFQQIKIEAAEDGIREKVWAAIQGHVGAANAITRRELIFQVYGVRVPETEDLSRNHMDRRIRINIEKLRKAHLILSQSGDHGYFIPESLAEVQGYVGEITSRATKMLNQAQKINEMAIELAGQMRLEVEA